MRIPKAVLLVAALGCSGGALPRPGPSLADDDADEGSSDDADVLTTGISAGVPEGDDAPSGSTSCAGFDCDEPRSCSDDRDCDELDENPCTLPWCDAGTCRERPRECDGGANACAEAGCDPETGDCVVVGLDERCPAADCQRGICAVVLDDDGALLKASCEVVDDDRPIPCDDADVCTTDDVCIDRVCQGERLDCTSAPASVCEGSTLVRFEGIGTCEAGACVFDRREIDCPDACRADLGHCQPPSYPVVTELIYDPDGTDHDVWIELWVPPSVQDLQRIDLEHVNGNNGAAAGSVTLEGERPVDGLVLLVGPLATPELLTAADVTDDFADLQNGPDNLLVRLDGVLVDALGWGAFAATETFVGETMPATDVSGTSSLARRGTWIDRDDNAVDFVMDPSPTPGSPNDVW